MPFAFNRVLSSFTGFYVIKCSLVVTPHKRLLRHFPPIEAPYTRPGFSLFRGIVFPPAAEPFLPPPSSPLLNKQVVVVVVVVV